jgi:hypothetical protein
MKIQTIASDGTVTWYAFDPGHREEIIAFYENLKATGEILNYRVMSEEGKL